MEQIRVGGECIVLQSGRVQIDHARILLEVADLVWAFRLHCRLLREGNGWVLVVIFDSSYSVF